MEKELQGREKRPKGKIDVGSPRATLKKIPNWKTPGHDGIQGYWFKKFASILNRLVIEINTCQEKKHTGMDD